MRVFIWTRIDKATDNYHAGGGVVVFAPNESTARELANAVPGCRLDAAEAPDEVCDVSSGDREPRVYIFPDAGCC